MRLKLRFAFSLPNISVYEAFRRWWGILSIAVRRALGATLLGGPWVSPPLTCAVEGEVALADAPGLPRFHLELAAACEKLKQVPFAKVPFLAPMLATTIVCGTW